MIPNFFKRSIAGLTHKPFIRHTRLLKFLKNHIRIIESVYYKNKIIPSIIAIENITDCNRKCPYCPHFWKESKRHLMPEQVYKGIINNLKEFNYSGKIIFAPWSEPLLDDRLADMIHYTKQKLPKCKIIVQTNGDLVTAEKFRELVRAGIDELDVSTHFSLKNGQYTVDLPNAAIKTYQQLTENEKKIFDFHDDNIDRIRRTIRFHNRSGQIPLEDLITMKDFCKKCLFPEEILSINHKGDILLCARQWEKDPVFGNAIHEDLRATWKKAEFKKTRDALRNGIFDLDLCQRCSFGYMPAPEGMPAFKTFSGFGLRE